jgi:hypothetical protein
MRRVAVALLLAIPIAASAASADLHAPLDSIDYGFGVGIVVDELTRTESQSLFQIRRNYDYSRDPSVAWGTGQSWFLMCALRDVASERSATQFKWTFKAKEPSTEPFASIGAEQLFVSVDWMQGTAGDVSAAVAKGIVPVNEQVAQFCAKIKAQGPKRP